MRQIVSDKLRVTLELKTTPIVLIACKKIGLPTSTYYRWTHEDKRFATEVKRAVACGREDVSDIAEAHLVRAVKKGDMRSVLFWLKTYRTAYKKQEKTIVEMQHSIEPRKEKRGRTDVLLPSIPDVSANATLSPKKMALIEKTLNQSVKHFFRERALSGALRDRGVTEAEIDALLEKVEETTKEITRKGSQKGA
jgi:hypothetical protein